MLVTDPSTQIGLHAVTGLGAVMPTTLSIMKSLRGHDVST
jgi:hypothetical protein